MQQKFCGNVFAFAPPESELTNGVVCGVYDNPKSVFKYIQRLGLALVDEQSATRCNQQILSITADCTAPFAVSVFTDSEVDFDLAGASSSDTSPNRGRHNGTISQSHKSKISKTREKVRKVQKVQTTKESTQLR